MNEVVVADIGGTNARFAIGVQKVDGQIELTHQAKLKVAEHSSLESAFQAWRQAINRPVPSIGMFAIAGPVDTAILRFANIPWVIHKAKAESDLGFYKLSFINDFESVANAVHACGPEDFDYVAGPQEFLPTNGVISIIGPGTGLGVAMLLMSDGRVVATEGGHIDYAPLDALDDRLLQDLRTIHRRVSVERIVSGPGLSLIHEVMAGIDGRAIAKLPDSELWAGVTEGADWHIRAAFDRWALSLGSVCGDLALAHGANCVVLSGGLLARVRHLLPATGFHARFCAKGRFETRMAKMPILSMSYPEPGLLGAAVAAFAMEKP